MKCPFCLGEITVLTKERAIAHTVPPCEKYAQQDVLTFFRNVRLATVGPVPDDAEWPLPVPQKPS